MSTIIFAVIAIFVFFKLREQLGKVDENQKRDAIRKFIKEQTKSKGPSNINNVVSIDGSKIDDEDVIQMDSKSSALLNRIDLNVKDDVVSVLKKANVTITDFVNGANKAFEMIIESFASADGKVLKSLLSPEILKQFESVIKERQKNGQTLHTQIVSIDSDEIVAAKMVKSDALITVKFSSKQINYTTDKDGKVVSGSKEEINSINDIWTFKKNCKSTNPNWLVSSTT